MLARLLRVGEMTGGFHHNLRADGCPIQLTGIALRENFQPLAANNDGVRLDLDVLIEAAENRIVLQQVG